MPGIPLPDPGIFDLFLRAFVSVFSLAWTGLTPQVLWLVSQLTIWALIPALLGMMAGFSIIMTPLAQLVIRTAFVVWAIANLQTLTSRFADWMVRIGLYVGSFPANIVGYQPMTLDQFMSPGTVMLTGFNMMLPVIRYVDELGWWDIATVLMYDFFVVIPLWIAITVVAINIIVAVVEFHIVAFWSLIPLAFATFSGTAFVASSAISGILASGVRLGALAFVTGIILPLTFYLALPGGSSEPALWNVMSAGAGAIFLAVMSIFAPRYAASFFGGGPAFTGATLVGFGVSMATAGLRSYQRLVMARS